MKRTKKKYLPNLKEVDAILVSDIHLREKDDTPISRADDFYEKQWGKIAKLRGLQEKYDCPVLHAGDLFHHWKPSPELLTKTIKELPDQFHTVWGNHDLPQHNLQLAHKAGISVLEAAGKVTILPGTHWNGVPEEPSIVIKGRKIIVWHTFTWMNRLPFPECRSPDAFRILRKYKEKYDLLVTGDNHISFQLRLDEVCLVNPGSLTRQTADQAHHKPGVYLYNAENNMVTSYKFEVHSSDIRSLHLQTKQDRDKRIEAFVSKLEGNWSMELSFEDNLKRFININDLRESVVEIIFKSLEL